MKKVKKTHISLYSYISKNGFNSFYISGFSFNQFCSAYKNVPLRIEIVHFYGDDGEKNYEPKNVNFIKNLKDLEVYVAKQKDLIINNLEFNTFQNVEMTVHFNDDFECTITSSSDNFLYDELKPLLDYLHFDKNLLQSLVENQNKYLGIGDDNSVVAIFDDFDNYLKSNYTTD